MSDPDMAQRLEEAAATLEEWGRYMGRKFPEMSAMSALGLRNEAARLVELEALTLGEVEGMSKDG